MTEHNWNSIRLVRWFEDRGYGFATCSTYPNVFLHIKASVDAFCNGTDSPQIVLGRTYDLPSHGDIILAEISKNNKGWYAINWIPQKVYDRVMREIECRPTFRIIEVRGQLKTRLASDLQWQEKIVYEGKDRRAARCSIFHGCYDDSPENNNRPVRYRIEMLHDEVWERIPIQKFMTA